MPKVAGTFTIKTAPAAAAFPDSGIQRMSLEKVYEGPLSGTAVGELISFRSAVAGSAGYVAIERVTASIDGAAGAFTLQHNGTMSNGGATKALNVIVVPDSGTGSLTGLSGTLDIVIEGGAHSYVFEYELPGAPAAH
jgi:hypothetical protein